jgi:hypothetical protein
VSAFTRRNGKAKTSALSPAHWIVARSRSIRVVRAVWDAFYAGFPLRPTDRLSDFGIDGLELDVLIDEVAERSAHSLKSLHEFWEDDVTLGDLVKFVSSQPKRPTGA